MSAARPSEEKSWAEGAVIYQIYPRSFKDSTYNGIGDLRGVIEKLDYLNDGTEKSLGVDAIWLSPIYKSPMLDFGYDVTDHKNISSLFGTLDIFDELVREAHKRNIRIILDFIPNHTSSSHPWFQESKKSLNNSKRDWYIWKDARPDGSLPNNWLSVFGGPAWTYDSTTKQYYMHTFLASQPDLNWRNPEVRKEMLDVMRFWLEKGVDGFRVDGISHLVEDDKLRDNPPNPNYVPGGDSYEAFLHPYTQERPETLAITEEFCKILTGYKDKFMVIEVHLDAPVEQLVKFYDLCGKYHSSFPFNFRLLGISGQAKELKSIIDEFDALVGSSRWPNYVLSNHDHPRVAERLGREKARLAAIVLLTSRGTPFIYYGDEIAMKDSKVHPKENDPRGKLTPTRDPARTPMQWTKDKFAGFSTVSPWLPLNEDYEKYNVEMEADDPYSMFSLYRNLIQLRKKSPALKFGRYQSVETGNKNIFAYTRTLEKEQILIVLNFSGEKQKASFNLGSKGKLLCNAHCDDGGSASVDIKNLFLRPYEGMVIRIK